MKTINYGIIGPGRIAGSYCRALEQSPGSKIYAIASRDEHRAQEFAKQFKAEVWYGSYDALAKDQNVDVIYIATPHSFHEQQALLCLQHKKPVVCEKPLALSAASAKRIIAASKSNKTFLMEGMWSRFNPAIIKAKELIDDGAIGQVRHLTADFGFQKPYDPKSRLYDPALAGGAILDVGVYPLFLALYLLGRPEDISASAQLAPTGVDESCAIALKYADGVMAQLFCSMLVETKKEAVISGTKGMILIHTPWYKSMGLTLIRNNNEEKIALPYNGNGFEFQVDEVNRCLAEGLVESPLLNHDFMIMKAEVSDEIIRQSGVVYPEHLL
jgi:predicted dehydrogenase